MTRTGELNRRVDIFRDTGTTQDEFGAHIEDWTLLGSRWAKIAPGAGSERFSDESERATQSIVITIRYDRNFVSGLTSADRARYTDGDANVFEYDIQSVSDKGARHEYVELLALLRSPEASRLP